MKWRPFRSGFHLLTHCGRVTHICVSNLTIIGSDNGLSPGRCQAIIWTNAGILFIGPLGTNFSEILIEILTISFKKMRLKVSSGKWRPFCFGLNVLTNSCYHNQNIKYITWNRHMVHILLCFIVVWHGSCLPISFRVASLAWGNHMIAPVPVKQHWRIWVNKSYESTKTHYTNHNNMSTTKPSACIYIMCSNLPPWNHYMEVLSPLLAQSPVDSPHKGPVISIIDFSCC